MTHHVGRQTFSVQAVHTNRGYSAGAGVGSGLCADGSGAAVAATSVGAAGTMRLHRGRAEEVPGTEALNAGGDAQVLAVSCWRATARRPGSTAMPGPPAGVRGDRCGRDHYVVESRCRGAVRA
ncbi:MAG: hypothetical protein ACLQFR_24600 [Streptosporangiaceae bacterium]